MDIRYTALTLAIRLAEITPEVADPERVVEIAREFERYLRSDPMRQEPGQ